MKKSFPPFLIRLAGLLIFLATLALLIFAGKFLWQKFQNRTKVEALLPAAETAAVISLPNNFETPIFAPLRTQSGSLALPWQNFFSTLPHLPENSGEALHLAWLVDKNERDQLGNFQLAPVLFFQKPKQEPVFTAGSGDTLTEELFSNEKIYSFQAQPEYFTCLENFCAAAWQKPLLEKIILTEQGRAEALVDNPDYRRVREKLPTGEARAFFNPNLILQSELFDTAPFFWKKFLGQMLLAPVRSAGLSFKKEGGGIRIVGAVAAEKSADSERTFFFNPPKGADTLNNLLPEGTAFAFHGFDLAGEWQNFLENLKARSPALALMLGQTENALDSFSVLNFLHQEYAVALDRRGALTFLTRVHALSETAVKKWLEEIRPAVSRQFPAENSFPLADGSMGRELVAQPENFALTEDRSADFTIFRLTGGSGNALGLFAGLTVPAQENADSLLLIGTDENVLRKIVSRQQTEAKAPAILKNNLQKLAPWHAVNFQLTPALLPLASIRTKIFFNEWLPGVESVEAGVDGFSDDGVLEMFVKTNQ